VIFTEGVDPFSFSSVKRVTVGIVACKAGHCNLSCLCVTSRSTDGFCLQTVHALDDLKLVQSSDVLATLHVHKVIM